MMQLNALHRVVFPDPGGPQIANTLQDGSMPMLEDPIKTRLYKA